jgi:hypothetical protein
MTKQDEHASIILETGQQVMLAGRTYTMRRLTTRDVFAFAKLIADAMKAVGNVAVSSAEELGVLMMAGMAEADEQQAEFYGSVIGLSAAEFLALEPAAFADFLTALQEHQDMMAFFDAVLKATRALGGLWQAPSTASARATGGRTKRS